MQADIQVEGAKELARAFRQAGNGLPKALREVHKKLAEIVVRKATPNVPVQSGALVRSVKALGSQQKASAKAGTAARVPYAPAVHWGTGPRPGLRGPHNIARKPFLWDALQATKSQVGDEYLAAVDELMEEALRSVRNR